MAFFSGNSSSWPTIPRMRNAEILVSYPSLAWTQQAIHDEMLRHLFAGCSEFTIETRVEPEDLSKAIRAVIFDHPELFWIASGCSWSSVTQGSRVTANVTANLEYPLSKVPSMQRRIEAVANRFAGKIPRNASTYEKVRAAYEFVVNNTTYDKNAPHNQSMAAVLLDHRAVCAGYSKAFCYLLRHVGVPCGCIEGVARGGVTGPHLWNIVCIDGTYTHVDATWGEMEVAQGAGQKKTEGITHKYLCVTTDEILRSRTIDSGQTVPRCTSWAYDWFARQGLLLDTFSSSQMDTLLVRASMKSARELGVKFRNQSAYNQCISWMGTSGIYLGGFGQRIRNASRGGRSSLSWTYDENLRIVTIRW